MFRDGVVVHRGSGDPVLRGGWVMCRCRVIMTVMVTAEAAVFRDGVWFVEGQATRFLGSPGDMPVPGDYDGDG